MSRHDEHPYRALPPDAEVSQLKAEIRALQLQLEEEQHTNERLVDRVMTLESNAFQERWEYKMIHCSFGEIQKELNQYSSQGWLLHSMDFVGGYRSICFHRRLR